MKTIIDARLKSGVGKRLIVVDERHSQYDEVGTGRSYDETDEGGSVLIIDFYDGSSGSVNTMSAIKIIDTEQKYLTIEEIIEQLAGSNYSLDQIALYLEMDKKKFQEQWNEPRSKLRFHYEKGRLLADFKINQKLLENAKSGNITAAQIFQKNQEAKKVLDVKKQVFYGFED